MGVPQDVAKIVAFLTGDAAGLITGQKFVVNRANTPA
jgi:NAD(P)-dependent dehydrogenase (short-subunit alcohol dehydrogenase family)